MLKAKVAIRYYPVLLKSFSLLQTFQNATSSITVQQCLTTVDHAMQSVCNDNVDCFSTHCTFTEHCSNTGVTL